MGYEVKNRNRVYELLHAFLLFYPIKLKIGPYTESWKDYVICAHYVSGSANVLWTYIPLNATSQTSQGNSLNISCAVIRNSDLVWFSSLHLRYFESAWLIFLKSMEALSIQHVLTLANIFSVASIHWENVLHWYNIFSFHQILTEMTVIQLVEVQHFPTALHYCCINSSSSELILIL